MGVSPQIQWFPGHMTKTRRMIAANLKLCDLVVEVTDARIPYSSRNPELPKLIGEKPRLVVLNKADSANPATTEQWCNYYKARGVTAIWADCRSGKGLNNFLPAVREALSELLERRKNKGLSGMPVRLMIVGIPNVGKSSLINRLSGKRSARVEDRPGVTRGKQWVTLQNGLELLDMPGVLWPKFEERRVAEHLAFTGSVKDAVLDLELLAASLSEVLCKVALAPFCQRFKLVEEEVLPLPGHEILKLVAKSRGMLLPGGALNSERAAIVLLDEFRGGLVGRISLEFPSKKAPDTKEASKAAEQTAPTEEEPENDDPPQEVAK